MKFVYFLPGLFFANFMNEDEIERGLKGDEKHVRQKIQEVIWYSLGFILDFLNGYKRRIDPGLEKKIAILKGFNAQILPQLLFRAT